jgi:hypothetical protein
VCPAEAAALAIIIWAALCLVVLTDPATVCR